MRLPSKIRFFRELWREPCYWIGHKWSPPSYAAPAWTHGFLGSEWRACQRCYLVEETRKVPV